MSKFEMFLYNTKFIGIGYYTNSIIMQNIHNTVFNDHILPSAIFDGILISIIVMIGKPFLIWHLLMGLFSLFMVGNYVFILYRNNLIMKDMHSMSSCEFAQRYANYANDHAVLFEQALYDDKCMMMKITGITLTIIGVILLIVNMNNLTQVLTIINFSIFTFIEYHTTKLSYIIRMYWVNCMRNGGGR